MNNNKPTLFDPFSFPKQFNTSVGFEPILKRLADMAESMPKIPTYPPYNIRKLDNNKYLIEMAVAGFGKQDIELELQEGTLTITGGTHGETNDDEYIFKGIADRGFTRKFTLADTVEVKNADLINGMLKIWLERFIPEEKKPKKIPINDSQVSSSGTMAPSSEQFLSEKYGDK